MRSKRPRAPETLDHLDAIERKDHHLIRRAIDERLTYTPDLMTRNRKPLEDPAPYDATWELRCGPKNRNRYRVFYEFDLKEREVLILAVGVKERNRLLIGGEEFKS
ncbi:MAG: type II toxin-antitoxin system RelE/ParE family toxin [Chloracidobacterium sp.]|nr:type II toxin-antitoxin system RelE/ParE family toxin [Chloracidobacterium sp.]